MQPPILHIEKVEYHNHIDTEAILSKLDHIIKHQHQQMGQSQERFDAIIARLNTITSDIAADYQKLLDAVKDTISPESFAAAESNIAQLEALGASVENPVPEPPVEPTP